MSLLVLLGDDSYAIAQYLNQLKAQLNPNWLSFNLHRYSAEQIQTAIATARTPPVMDTQRLVIVTDCPFKSWSMEQLADIDQLPDSTTLALLGQTLDKRTKVAKYLTAQGMVMLTYERPKAWDVQGIECMVSGIARRQGLRLPKGAIAYLAEALGNDTRRMEAELVKLSVYANGRSLSLSAVQQVIPNQTHSSLKLAEAMRQGRTAAALYQLQALLATNHPLMVITSTLLTQFRTWLWVKAAMQAGIHDNHTLAQHCQMSNPKRMYYLKQEVKGLRLSSLVQAQQKLFDCLEAIKYQGQDALLTTILSISQRIDRQ